MSIADRDLVVTWPGDPFPHRFPGIYLRDNCQCELCYHPKSKARLVLMANLDVDIAPKAASVDEDTGEVRYRLD